MTDKTDKKPFHSPFKRVCVTDDGGQKIKELQQEFDKFWRKIHRYADKSPEKYYAQKAMQEACMWLARGCALKNERVPKPVIDDPIKPKTTDVKNPFGHALDVKSYFSKLPQMKPGETITNNGVRIVIKPRK